ncbi:MAG TPA: sigma-54 dependent transcriptional regulator [Gemmatimonadaceae bacterium]|jgi:DNA-binding NtrC family response regulator|nr:sigma-54 dependent transcriptional regulator [Gemmatimonadaceae bacterium]
MTAVAASAPTVLVIDDEMGILDTIRILLKSEGFTPYTALGGKKGLEQIAALKPELIITDVRMPDVTGLDILAFVRAHDPEAVVILMTAQASLQSAIGAVNNGAFYYVQKPFKNEELVAIVRRAAEHRNLRRENKTLKAEMKRRDPSSRPVGASKPWLDALSVAESVAGTDSTVLLQGESGTGKEVVARYIHDLSARATKPFLSINCGALPESLLESELFGHVKGSFTGASRDKEGLFSAAGEGTFFLDEIGETTPATQVKLLRVLQQREVIPVGSTEAKPVNARVIAATNRDLEDEIKRGNFRNDLFYRLNVISIVLPPLRDRPGDIALLSEAFLLGAAEARGEPQRTLTPEAAEAMEKYSWPGNVRELENALERAAILAKGDTIPVSALPERVVEPKSDPLVGDGVQANPTLDTIERAYIMWVLENEGGNKPRTAEVLGIDPSTLYRKLSRYGLPT